MQRKRGTTAQLFGMRLPILFEICFFQDLMEQQHQHRFSAFWLRSKCSICSYLDYIFCVYIGLFCDTYSFYGLDYTCIFHIGLLSYSLCGLTVHIPF